MADSRKSLKRKNVCTKIMNSQKKKKKLKESCVNNVMSQNIFNAFTLQYIF